ncbi:hypothetical protein [Agrobacterium sp. NPDC089420]|uniref:hypothetical protein n=1 Tax=Agrobacterium sp. NPDC089420 TaxID=3363918 RepID=UPI00384F04D4
MFLVKHAITKRVFLGSIEFDLDGFDDISRIELEEELQRLICSVSGRPNREGL